jgi:hypothetical protein
MFCSIYGLVSSLSSTFNFCVNMISSYHMLTQFLIVGKICHARREASTQLFEKLHSYENGECV